MQRGGDAEDAQPTHVWTLGLRFEQVVCKAAKACLQIADRPRPRACVACWSPG